MSEVIYCVDTSSLIECKQVYSIEVFPTLWDSLAGIVEAGRLIAPREVLREIEKQDDELLAWVKTNKKMFVPPTDDQLAITRNILRNFPNLVDPTRATPQADPFVIALGVEEKNSGRNCIVVTEEAMVRPPSPKVKIPNVCDAHGILCIGILELFKREGWKF